MPSAWFTFETFSSDTVLHRAAVKRRESWKNLSPVCSRSFFVVRIGLFVNFQAQVNKSAASGAKEYNARQVGMSLVPQRRHSWRLNQCASMCKISCLILHVIVDDMQEYSKFRVILTFHWHSYTVRDDYYDVVVKIWNLNLISNFNCNMLPWELSYKIFIVNINFRWIVIISGALTKKY